MDAGAAGMRCVQMSEGMLKRLLELVEMQKDKNMPASHLPLDKLAAGLSRHLGEQHEQLPEEPISLRQQNVRPSSLHARMIRGLPVCRLTDRRLPGLWGRVCCVCPRRSWRCK
jgi:hypothetical protein